MKNRDKQLIDPNRYKSISHRAAKVFSTALEVVRQRVPTAEVYHAVLPDLPWPDDSFDAVIGNFVINHVGDPLSAVAEMRRVVRSGGRAAVTIWPQPSPPLQRLWGQAFDASGCERPSYLPTLASDKEFERTPDGLSQLLCSAELRDVHCEVVRWVHRTDPEDWWAGPANDIGTLGVLMQSQPSEVVLRIRQEYDQLTEVCRDDDEMLALPTAALLASGTVS